LWGSKIHLKCATLFSKPRENSNDAQETTMPLVTSETVRQVLRDLYGYEISDADANSIAHSAGAMLTLAGHLGSIGLAGVEPPFGYAVFTSEAARLNKNK
jgi:hypothetical protein